MTRVWTLAVVLAVGACAPKAGPGPQTGGAAGQAGPDTAADPNAIPPEKLEEVMTTFRDKGPIVGRCHSEEVERSKNPNLEASMTVHVSIAPTGEVQDANIAAQQNASPDFQRCVVDAVKKFQFPQLPAVLDTSYPYQFKPAY